MSITLSALGSLTYTPYDGANAMQLANALNLAGSGINIVSATYTGFNGATSLIAAGGSQGVLATTGNGTPNTTNTVGSYGEDNNQPGDADLDAIIYGVFSGAGDTQDATRIDIQFTVVDPSLISISLSALFGSDEFPEFSNTSFVDIAAILVDGVNYALFNGEATQPLSVLEQNLTAGNFVDNLDGHLPIEYDGISTELVIVAPLNTTLQTHTLSIMIADTGDGIYDSGIFLSALTATNRAGSGGTKLIVEGSSGSDLYQGGDYAEQYFGGEGNDTVYAADGNDDIFGNTGDDYIYGQVGNDFTQAGQGDDIAFGGQGNDTVYGNLGGDDVYGNLGDDQLYGGQSDDILYGGQGGDAMVGNLGNDTLIGNMGNDTLSGLAGDDTYLFAGRVNSTGFDLITELDAGDHILFVGMTADDVETSADGANTLIALTNGGIITVVGAAPAAVEASYIFA